MTANAASEQAALAGDVPTSQDGQSPTGILAVGSLSRSGQTETVTPTQVEATEPPAEEQKEPVAAVPEKLTPKSQRKSDKEWQEAQEKAQTSETLAQEVAEMKQKMARLEFEKKFPIAEQYKDQLDAMQADPRWAAFSWEERLQFIHKPDMSGVKQDMKNQATKQQGSVVTSTRSEPAGDGVSPTLLQQGAAWFGSEEKAKELYKKYGIR